MSALRQSDAGRVNQKNRTREGIVRAAGELLRRGAIPSVAEAAEAALVSQATAYRYFPTQTSMLEEVIAGEMRIALGALDALERTGDPYEDVNALARTILGEIAKREPEHRWFLRLTLERWLSEERDGLSLERGGRVSYIVDAIEPLRPRLGEPGINRLAQALSLAIGIEAILVLRDVWGLKHQDVAGVSSWTCRALITQALEEGRLSRTASDTAATKAIARSRKRRTKRPRP